VDVERAPALRAASSLGRAARVAFVFGGLGALMLAGVPLCPFALVTRQPCPGCGLGRATFAMLRGDFGEAMHVHPLAPLLVPVIVVALGYNAALYVRRGRWGAAEGFTGRVATWGAGVLFALMIGLWIARFAGLFGGPAPV
jgi:hypothetical protein